MQTESPESYTLPYRMSMRRCVLLSVCMKGREGERDGWIEGEREALERAASDPHTYRDGVELTIHGRFLFGAGFLQGRHARG